MIDHNHSNNTIAPSSWLSQRDCRGEVNIISITLCLSQVMFQMDMYKSQKIKNETDSQMEGIRPY